MEIAVRLNYKLMRDLDKGILRQIYYLITLEYVKLLIDMEMREGRICYQKGMLITTKHMKKIEQFLSNLLFPNNLTYVGIITRVFIIFIFQSFFHMSPFNFQARPNASVVDIIIFFTIAIPTYALLICYAFQAVIRIGTVAETSNTPKHEKIIAVIVLISVILLFLYTSCTSAPGIPWYLE
jgi:hypothetical protein